MSYQLEIERKFLVHKEKLPTLGVGASMAQGYLSFDAAREVRVRLLTGQAFLGIKVWCDKMTRHEYTYDIPLGDAKKMLTQCIGVLHKLRHILYVDGVEWCVDCFDGQHEGLVLAEVELSDRHDTLVLPDWVGEEVTHQQGYYSRFLACGSTVR